MNTPDLAEIRARAEQHGNELDRDTRFFTVADLAKRWCCSTTSVRDIPAGDLPYLNLGRGLHRELRRYRPSDVYAYEAARLDRAG